MRGAARASQLQSQQTPHCGNHNHCNAALQLSFTPSPAAGQPCQLHHRHHPRLGRHGPQQRLKKVPVLDVQSRAPSPAPATTSAAAAVIAKQQRRLKRNCIYSQGSGAAGGGARHSGAPMLRRYAITSALSCCMAYLSAVVPRLQGR